MDQLGGDFSQNLCDFVPPITWRNDPSWFCANEGSHHPLSSFRKFPSGLKKPPFFSLFLSRNRAFSCIFYMCIITLAAWFLLADFLDKAQRKTLNFLSDFLQQNRCILSDVPWFSVFKFHEFWWDKSSLEGYPCWKWDHKKCLPWFLSFFLPPQQKKTDFLDSGICNELGGRTFWLLCKGMSRVQATAEESRRNLWRF